MKPEIVATGIRVGEGPTWRPAHGDLLVTSVADGLLWRVDPACGSTSVFADVGGGPNSSALCDDGGVLITQNGGLDLSLFGALPPEQIAPPRKVPPCLQRVLPDGSFYSVCGEGLVRCPNDLVVTADGSVLFTDPPGLPPPPGAAARLLRYRSETARAWTSHTIDPAGQLEVLDEFEHYLNGVALSPDGRILTVEASGLRWFDPDGTRSWFIRDLGGGVGDGMTFDVDGCVYVCLPGAGLHVFDERGKRIAELELPDGAMCLNCCFGGERQRTLFATDAAHGTVLAWEGMPTPGWPGTTYR